VLWRHRGSVVGDNKAKQHRKVIKMEDVLDDSIHEKRVLFFAGI
jgi:hypothetical protein